MVPVANEKQNLENGIYMMCIIHQRSSSSFLRKIFTLLNAIVQKFQNSFLKKHNFLY